MRNGVLSAGSMVFLFVLAAAAQAEPAKETAPAASSAVAAHEPEPSRDDSGSWERFTSASRALAIDYPNGWHKLEKTQQFPYVVTIKPTPPSADANTMAPTVIEVFKYYHASRTLPFAKGTSEEILEKFLTEVLPSTGQPGTRLVKQEPITVQSVPGRVAELQGKDPRGDTELQIMVMASIKDDVLVALFCQSPQGEFAAMRAVCEHVIRTVEPFSADPKVTDNILMDEESGRLGNDALAALQVGDGNRMVEAFEEAIRINPGYPVSHLNYGSILMTLAKEQQADESGTLLDRAEEELKQAVRLFEQSGDPVLALYARADRLLSQRR